MSRRPQFTHWPALALLVLALPLLASRAAAQAFTVTGRCVYVDKAWNWDGWTGAKPPRPIRRADVIVLNHLTGLVLGSGSTQADGSFSITCLATFLPDIQVRCEADTDNAAGFQRLRVTNEANFEYMLESPIFPAHNPLFPLDVGTLTALPMPVGASEGQPFNLLDLGVSAMEYVTGPLVGASPVPQMLRFAWPSPGGTFTNGITAHIGEDDGYDDAVVLHEFGHLVHNAWSGNITGGPHWFGDSDQDPRLAFSEGFATCFGGVVQNTLGLEALYVDCNGGAQVGGVQLRLRLETVAPWADECYGEADEVAVACTLFDLLDDETSPDLSPGSDDDAFQSGTLVVGASMEAAWWGLFTGLLGRELELALDDAWDGWLLQYADDNHLPEMETLFDARRIRFVADEQEPDGSPGDAAPLPAVEGATWSDERTLYVPATTLSAQCPADAADAGEAPGPGADEDYYAVPLVKGDVIQLATRYPQGVPDAETECDPYLELYTPSGTLLAADEDGGVGRNALLPSVAIPASGDWLVRVGTHSSLRRYGRYELRVLYLSQNHPPQIVSGPSAFPSTLRSGDSAQLSALATDADGDLALEYLWTPLDGGVIAGSGPDVSFVPPTVMLPTNVRVQLVVTDSLGAESQAAEVGLTVLPMTGGLCPSPASWLSIGTGKPGLGGKPVLSGLGLPVVPGNGCALHATGLTPQLSGFLVFGFAQLAAPFDGGTLYAAPDLLLPVTPNGSGELIIPLVLPPEPLLCGLSICTQVIVPGDPGATGAKHTAQSNGLKVTFGD